MESCKEKRRKMDVGGRQDIDCCITKVFSDVTFLYIKNGGHYQRSGEP
jgi:hypothetical protein